jgi:hypothetical protein
MVDAGGGVTPPTSWRGAAGQAGTRGLAVDLGAGWWRTKIARVGVGRRRRKIA